jgi:hypothetical protein
MSRQTFLRISAVLSGASVAFTVAWAATEASWALWGACTSLAGAVGCIIGAYIEPETD